MKRMPTIGKPEFLRRVEYFKSEVLNFIKFFNMETFEIFFNETTRHIRASCYWNPILESYDDQRILTLEYSTDWLSDPEVRDVEISKTAMHEVLEGWLYKLREFGDNQTVVIPTQWVDTEIHKVIRLFENKLHDKIKSSIEDKT